MFSSCFFQIRLHLDHKHENGLKCFDIKLSADLAEDTLPNSVIQQLYTKDANVIESRLDFRKLDIDWTMVQNMKERTRLVDGFE